MNKKEFIKRATALYENLSEHENCGEDFYSGVELDKEVFLILIKGTEEESLQLATKYWQIRMGGEIEFFIEDEGNA